MSETEKTKPKTNSVVQGSRLNADNIGMAGAIILSWALATWGGVEVPDQVGIAIGVLIGGIAARIRR